ASNDLDERIIASLKSQGATICVWGVGTKLATAYDQPAMGGVYKLAAVRRPGSEWEYKVKLSEQAIKTSTPGIQQVRRFSNEHEYVADAIYDDLRPMSDGCTIIDPMDITRRKVISAGTSHVDLLVPITRAGKIVYEQPSLDETRSYVQDQLGRFHPGVKRFVNPHQYPVGLERNLYELKNELVLKARGL
ncbi:MAG: nicotinate phosphoribosyltransferase, partial [Planctomycetota bacterium]|nr:nicotinate phosphoribosyltransferase [Planctomycetota bacterium]